jgi:hypothetical protein
MSLVGNSDYALSHPLGQCRQKIRRSMKFLNHIGHWYSVINMYIGNGSEK